MVCPGSLALEEKYKTEDQSPAAREGSHAHEVARRLLEGGLICMEPQDMIDGANLYRDHVRSIVGDAVLHIEERVNVPLVHPECWGTPDLWALVWWQEIPTLHVWDYKFGYGPVEVYQNWQLLTYAAGIVGELKDAPVSVHLHIVQPRAWHRDGPIRTWVISNQILFEYIARLQQSEFLALQPDAPCIPSIECTHCTARHACSALQRRGLAFADLSAETVPLELTPSQTGNELRILHHAAKLLDARITGLEEQARSMLANGKRVPHYRMEPGMGREIWKRPVSEVVMLGEMLDVHLKKPAELITPKQAVKAGIPREVVNQYSEQQKGALKLVPDDGSNARKIFNADV
jgi:hypothetical protein